jgi:hypothetical protein
MAFSPSWLGKMYGARREPLIRATLSQATAALTNLTTQVAKVQHVSTPPRQPALVPAILHPHAASSSHAASLRRAARRWHLQVVATISHLPRPNLAQRLVHLLRTNPGITAESADRVSDTRCVLHTVRKPRVRH